MGAVKWDLEHRGAMCDLLGQAWRCPTHMAPPDFPGTCPTAPLSITSVGETHSITAVAGGQLILECPEDAVPSPHIEWHREGSLLRVRVVGPGTGHRQGLGCTFASPVLLVVGAMWGELLTGSPRGCQEDDRRQVLAEGRFLQIRAVGAADGGEYSCRATNALGDTSLRVQVEVHGE